MKAVKFLTITLFFIAYIPSQAGARPSMAFGYLANRSLDFNYEYLETIFPNSFANSLKNIFDMKVYKPAQVKQRLREHNEPFKKSYQLHELPVLLEQIDADYFIFGNFTPLTDNRIEIVLNLYRQGSNRVFTFTNIGKMESEIFKLVDRITMIIVNFMDDEQLYKSAAVPEGSTIAIMTNIQGNELNELYLPFLQKGYTLSFFQGNTLKNPMTDQYTGYLSSLFRLGNQNINSFQYITTEANSYQLITRSDKLYMLGGTWSDRKHMKQVRYKKKIIKFYDTEYLKTKNILLSKLSLTFNNTIDILLIIGLNKGKNSAWVRCIDVKSRELIWMQSNIEGSTYSEISTKIIRLMSRSPQILFQRNN